jgi:hypothetical protein
MQNRTGLTVLAIGLIAGTLDIGENLIYNQLRGVAPWAVFQYIASGLIGRGAFQSGWASVGLGVALHYLIALFWAALFYAASLKLATMREHAVLCGLIYGGLIYLFMNIVVLPVSLVPHATHPISAASIVNGVLALMQCLGVPVSVLTSRLLTNGRREKVVM